jgi:hypothetical protein
MGLSQQFHIIPLPFKVGEVAILVKLLTGPEFARLMKKRNYLLMITQISAAIRKAARLWSPAILGCYAKIYRYINTIQVFIEELLTSCRSGSLKDKRAKNRGRPGARS